MALAMAMAMEMEMEMEMAVSVSSALAGCGGAQSPQPPQAVQVTRLQTAQLRGVRSETWKQTSYVVRSNEEWVKGMGHSWQ